MTLTTTGATDPRLDYVLHAIHQPGPVDDDPRNHEPDGYTQAELDRLADEAADLDYDRRTR